MLIYRRRILVSQLGAGGGVTVVTNVLILFCDNNNTMCWDAPNNTLRIIIVI